jgi:hypothetical protein
VDLAVHLRSVRACHSAFDSVRVVEVQSVFFRAATIMGANVLRTSLFFLTVPVLTIFLGCSSPPLALGDININYPPPNSVDVFNLRGCPLDYHPMGCPIIGTRGPVKKISSMDEDLKVLDGYIQFDRQGKLYKVCGRGHADFEGWSCRKGPFWDWPDVLQTQLDSNGRVTRRLHFQFDKTKFDTCSYDDDGVPHTSECNDGTFIHKYTYDKLSRPLTYSKRRIPVPGQAPERERSLERAYAMDVRFIYTDDEHGNWTEYRIVQEDSTFQVRIGIQIFRRTIEYY